MSIKNICLITLFSALTVSSLTLTGCKKDDDNTVENTGYAEEQAKLESAFNDLDIIPMRAFYSGAAGLKGDASILAACATVSIDTVGALDIMTIDFGQQNCLCFDGKYRKGKLIVYYSGDYKDSLHYRRVEPNNYFLNDHKIMGVREVTGRGLDDFGRQYYNVTFNGKVYGIDPKDGAIEGSGNRTYAWTMGLNTPQIHDDVFEMDGVGELTRNSGEKFTTEVLTPLEIAMDCNWVRRGVIRITPENATRRSLDFGDGECDDRAAITVNGSTREVILAL